MFRFISVLIFTLSIAYAHEKLDPGYDIPPHVHFILRTYQAIDKEDVTLINPCAFDRPDLHRSLTLFFDPHWGDKLIPTSLKELEKHYGHVRKILKYPYWAHLKCLEVLSGFECMSYLTKENILDSVPVLFHDPIKKEQTSHEKMYPILLSLRSVKESHRPYAFLIRENLPLDIALPTEIENPLFLMALARSLQYFPCTMLEVMQQFNAGEIPEDQFAQTLKAHMMDKNNSEHFSKFEYINWYITHYNVFGE